MTIIIDSVTYEVPIVDLDENCDFLDKFAERTEDGVLHRELIGTYHNQKLVFGDPLTTAEREEYALLWAKLSEATEFHVVTVPNVDGADYTFTAYFSRVTRKLSFWTDGTTRWKNMTGNFTAQSPKDTP